MSYLEYFYSYTHRFCSKIGTTEFPIEVPLSRDGDLSRPGGEPGSPDPNERVTGAGAGIPGLHKAGPGTGEPARTRYIYNIIFLYI